MLEYVCHIFHGYFPGIKRNREECVWYHGNKGYNIGTRQRKHPVTPVQKPCIWLTVKSG